REIILCCNTVPQRFPAMPAIVRGFIGLSIARAAAIVRRKQCVTMVDQVLYEFTIFFPYLPTGSSVHVNQSRYLSFCSYLVWLPEQTRDLETIEGAVAYLLWFHEISCIYIRS